ncbi:hypothetical protein COS75_02160 [Candidatus Pacearchaeota archaeon CG06_land_8_20_14_3_00_35_12]|nr:MAG: hypothetical protein COS75_02160 [Candidatus Pacearchaeota archaeon CG06_land_8_20_14_3_00_35_12]
MAIIKSYIKLEEVIENNKKTVKLLKIKITPTIEELGREKRYPQIKGWYTVDDLIETLAEYKMGHKSIEFYSVWPLKLNNLLVEIDKKSDKLAKDPKMIEKYSKKPTKDKF